MKQIIGVCLFVALACVLFGQADANKGQINGTVLDPKQAVVPNATIRIKSAATNATREVKSGGDGEFRFVLLDPGQYDVTVEAPGFAPAELKGVVIAAGSAVRLPVALALGTTAVVIEVTEAVTGVDLTAPTSIIGSNAIQNLPINGRRFTDFATLTPSVQINPQRGSISFAGQRGIYGNIMVDGADYNNPFFGGARGGERSNFVPTVPQSAVQEFQAVTTGYTAEYGRSTGGLLNVVSKSGANDVHGDLFYQIRPQESAQANPLVATVRATFTATIGETREKLQQFGGGAGGAIRKDKLFWFAAAERQLSKLPRQVFYAGITGIAPTAANQEALSFYQGLQGPIESTNDATVASGRLDYQPNGTHRLTTRFNVSDANANNAVTSGAPLPVVETRALSGTGAEQDRTYTGTAQYTAILSPTIANDLRFSATHEVRPRTSNSAVPNVNAGGLGNFGARNFLPTVQDDTRYQINNGLSITRGTHNMKFGGDYNYLTTFQRFGFNQFGSFSFANTAVSTVLANMSVAPGHNRFDDTNVRYQLNIGNLLADYHMTQLAFYAQDQWKITPQLQINFGLRWEGQRNPQPVATNTSVVQTMQNTTFPLNGKYDPTRTQNNLNQWMPRFGFTYSPFKGSARTVIRGHAGLFYAATPMLLYGTGTNNFRATPGDLSLFHQGTNAATTVYQLFRVAGVDLNAAKLDNLPILTPTQATNAIAAITGVAPNPFLGASFTGTANDFVNPRALQFGLGMDQEIGSGWVLSGQFNYVNTVHLERNRDYNLPRPVVRAADGRPIFTRANRPLPQYGQITLRESSARSMYRGASFSVRRTASKRIQFGAQYTLAQAYDDDSNERDATCCRYDNAANFKAEYGYSNYDIRSQFSGWTVYNLPWGLHVSGTLTASTGQPIDPLAGSNLNGDSKSQSTSGDRAYRAVGVPFARNSFRNVGWRTVNLRVMKDLKFGERYNLQLSAEMFNLFNFDNIIVGPADVNNTNTVYGPGINTDGSAAAVRSTFMQIRRADGLYDANNMQLGTPFQAQFGIRFFF